MCDVRCALVPTTDWTWQFIYYYFHWRLTDDVRIPSTSTGLLFCQSSMIFARAPRNFDGKPNSVAAMRYILVHNKLTESEMYTAYEHTHTHITPTRLEPMSLMTKMTMKTKTVLLQFDHKNETFNNRGKSRTCFRNRTTQRLSHHISLFVPLTFTFFSAFVLMCVWVHWQKVSRVFHVHKIPYCLRR